MHKQVIYARIRPSTLQALRDYAAEQNISLSAATDELLELAVGALSLGIRRTWATSLADVEKGLALLRK